MFLSGNGMYIVSSNQEPKQRVEERICSSFLYLTSDHHKVVVLQHCGKDYLVAVSYTHLDVYKRQALWFKVGIPLGERYDAFGVVNSCVPGRIWKRLVGGAFKSLKYQDIARE